MSRDVQLLFLIAFVLFLMQAIGGFFQIKDYQKAIRRVHRFGNVGFGQKKGGLLTGYIVLIACDQNGVITKVEVMDGLTFLAKFHPCSKLLGKPLEGATIWEFLSELRALEPKQRKRLKGYLQALEALELRLSENCEEAE